MPSKSEAQRRTMAAIAHGWHPAKGDVAKIPVAVAKDFNKADAAKARAKALRGQRK